MSKIKVDSVASASLGAVAITMVIGISMLIGFAYILLYFIAAFLAMFGIHIKITILGTIGFIVVLFILAGFARG
jgi:hypothetical protein